MDKKKYEVKTPDYYTGKVYGFKAHEIIEDFVGDNYNIGVAMAYLMRAGKKPNNDIKKDLQKAIDHLNFELKRQNNANKLRRNNQGINTTRKKCHLSTYNSWFTTTSW